MTDEELRRSYRGLVVTNYQHRVKKKAVEYKGGGCQVCGYSKCLSALVFHHRNPHEKEFQVSAKRIKWEKLVVELDKCDLLCSNCHQEEHERLANIRRQELWNKVRTAVSEKVSAIVKVPCDGCGKEVVRRKSEVSRYRYERSFCSSECAHSSQEKAKWPSREALEKLVWAFPATEIARELGVSSVAVKKRCKRLGVPTPGRGYWSQK